jgi:hypothetical protein
MTTWIATNHPDRTGLGAWHAGVPRYRFTDKTRRLVGTHLVTRCSGRQLGGPWGYSTAPNGPATAGYYDQCSRCVALLAADRAKFQRKARAGLEPHASKVRTLAAMTTRIRDAADRDAADEINEKSTATGGIRRAHAV